MHGHSVLHLRAITLLLHTTVTYYLLIHYFCCCLGNKFYFRGCGWTNFISTKKWSASHKRWIEAMDETFTTFFGKDYLSYEYTEKLCCIVAEDDHPRLERCFLGKYYKAENDRT